MKRFLGLMIEPAFLPLQLVALFYSGLIEVDRWFDVCVLSIWYLLMPMLCSFGRVKYNMLNLPKRIWLRDYIFSCLLWSLPMLAIAAWRNPNYLAFFSLLYLFGVAFGLWAYGKDREPGTWQWWGEKGGGRPTLPAWAGVVMVPMLGGWLAVLGVAILGLGFASTHGIELENLAAGLGAMFGVAWLFPMLAQHSCRSWILLNRPKIQWIRLSWLCDVIAVGILVLIGYFLWLSYPGQVQLIPVLAGMFTVAMILVSSANTLVFTQRVWLMAVYFGLTAGLGAAAGVGVVVKLDEHPIVWVGIVAIAMLAVVMAVPVRKHQVFGYVPVKEPNII